MNETKLEQLLYGETLTIEYKDNSKKDFSDDLIIKACVGMANADGGVILVGVDDNGNIVGDKKAKIGCESMLEGMIRERTNPSVNTIVKFINYNDKLISLIIVEKNPHVVSTTSGVFFIRQINSHGKPENKPMTIDQILRKTSKIGPYDLSADKLNGLSIDDIDIDLVKTISANIIQKTSLDSDIEIFSKEPIDVLKSLGLFYDDITPNIACLLLFGKEKSIENKIPNHFVQYQVFGETGQILKNEKYYLPITKILPELLNKPELIYNSNEFILNGQSIVIPEYSNDALREAFANALIHRDYTMHSGIQIQVYKGELKITNSGGFLDSISIDKLLSVPPTPRNMRLSDAMMRMKFIEKSGRGIDIIYYFQAKYGRILPDYSMSTNNSVVLRLVGGQADLEFCKFITPIISLSLLEMLILNSLFYNESMNIDEISKLVQSSVTNTENILNNLAKNKLIEIIDVDNIHIYSLKGFMKKKRISKSNIEDIKFRILGLLGNNVTLTSTEISSILHLSVHQVYRILKLLENDEKIILVGKCWMLKTH